MISFNVLDIIRGTTVDGPGFRTSIYLSGCNHKCPGCHNPDSHDPHGGTSWSLDKLMEVIREEDFNVTLSGGDPLYHPESTEVLVKTIVSEGFSVWIYTGYTWEEIISDRRLLNAVEQSQVVVDGPFVRLLKDPDLRFRGSSNQRIIDIGKSLATQKIVLWEDQ